MMMAHKIETEEREISNDDVVGDDVDDDSW